MAFVEKAVSVAGSSYYGFPKDLPVKRIEWQTNFSEANMYIDIIMINIDIHNTEQHDTPKRESSNS